MKRLAFLVTLAALGLGLIPVRTADAAPPSCRNHEGTDADRTTHLTHSTEGSYDANEEQVPADGLDGLLGETRTEYTGGGTARVDGVLSNTCRDAVFVVKVYADSGLQNLLGTSATYQATGSEDAHEVPFTVDVPVTHESNCVYMQATAEWRSRIIETTDASLPFCDAGGSGGRTMF